MKAVKLIAGGLLLAATYCAGKIVGEVTVAKYVVDGLEERFPGFKKTAAKHASEKVIDAIFDGPKKEEESQQ